MYELIDNVWCDGLDPRQQNSLSVYFKAHWTCYEYTKHTKRWINKEKKSEG